MSSDLGFGKSKRLDLSGFSPRQSVVPDAALADQDIADRTAERAGFKSREPVQRVKRVRKAAEPLDQAFVRAPTDVINRFKQYCNDTGMSYGEALDVLMRKSGF